MFREAPVCNRMTAATVVTAQTERAVFAPLRATVDHRDVAVRAAARTKAATAAGVGSVELRGLHQPRKEPGIDNPAQKSRTRAESEVHGLLAGKYTGRYGLDPGARDVELLALALFRVYVHEWHANIAQRHNHRVDAADNAAALAHQTAPLAVNMARLAAARADHMDHLAVEISVFQSFYNDWRHAPGIDREYPHMIIEVTGQQLGEHTGNGSRIAQTGKATQVLHRRIVTWVAPSFGVRSVRHGHSPLWAVLFYPI